MKRNELHNTRKTLDEIDKRMDRDTEAIQEIQDLRDDIRTQEGLDPFSLEELDKHLLDGIQIIQKEQEDETKPELDEIEQELDTSREQSEGKIMALEHAQETLSKLRDLPGMSSLLTEFDQQHSETAEDLSEIERLDLQLQYLQLSSKAYENLRL